MGIKYLPLFNIQDDYNLNNDDDHYVILGPYCVLGSVLMPLHVTLFLEIPDTAGLICGSLA